jgi:aryl-alcohol dehydrogenase-like predicted oxidoreductase
METLVVIGKHDREKDDQQNKKNDLYKIYRGGFYTFDTAKFYRLEKRLSENFRTLRTRLDRNFDQINRNIQRKFEGGIK